MNKEQLENRLQELNSEIEASSNKINEIAKEKDLQLQEKIANHNLIIGRKMEISELLAKFD